MVNSSDAAHFIVWKRDGLLAPFVPEDVAQHYPAEHKDADGLFASFRVGLSVIGYNTNLVKAEDAPKSFADLLDPKWEGKIVKAHPGYSGTIMTATFQMCAISAGTIWRSSPSRTSCRCSRRPTRRRSSRSASAPCRPTATNTTCSSIKEAGQPVEPVYATEGTPLMIGPNGHLQERAEPECRAAVPELSASPPECQQLIIDVGGQRSVHPQVKEKPGRKPFKEIKPMKEDAAGVEKKGEEIKARYIKLFKV